MRGAGRRARTRLTAAGARRRHGPLRLAADTAWRCGPVEFDGHASSTDGSGWLFDDVAKGTAEAYLDQAENYFERKIDADAVRAVMAGEPLTAEVVRTLNPYAVFGLVAEVARRAGHPVVDPI